MNKRIRKAICFIIAIAVIISINSEVESLGANVYAAGYTLSYNTSSFFALYNIGSGKYLNINYNRNANNTNVDIYTWDGTAGEKYKLAMCGSGYKIIPQCATNKVLNVYGNSAKNGSNICIWSYTGHNTQQFIFEYNPSYKAFIIRSANNKNLVLTATGSKNSSNVCLKTYQAGNKFQLWLSNAITVKENKTSTKTSSAATTAANVSNKATTAAKAATTTSSGLKSYTYKGTKYTILSNATTYSGSRYNQFNSNYKSTFGKQGCGSCACACAIAIKKNKHTDPKKYWVKGSGCTLSKYGSVGSVTGEAATLKKSIELIKAKTPGVLQMSSPDNHFVTVIGYKTDANTSKPSRSDILVMDPGDGKIKTLTEAMKYNYNKKIVNSVRWFKSIY